MTMQGQWFGFLEGSTPGHVVLDIDEISGRYSGTALFVPTDSSLPSTAALIETEVNDPIKVTSAIFAVNEADRSFISPADFMASNPEIIHPEEAIIELMTHNGDLAARYTTGTPETGIGEAAGILSQQRCPEKSSYAPETALSWNEYKIKVSEFAPEDYVWRGQTEPWSLQTSFHRSGRVNLHRYVFDDIPRLQAALLPHTATFLNLSNPLLSGGLYSLAQHHGYPTPILDWTYSPYVAAFFALHALPKSPDRADSVARIFAFHRKAWPQESNPITHLSFARPHVTFTDLVPLENNRALPQQALAMVSTVPNIEEFVRFRERETQKTFLSAFDLPWSERDRALRDLRTMGITAATMFPGIDGTCKELRDRYFD